MGVRTGVLLVALLAAYTACLGRHGLLEPDEARYAEIAREMRASGDYVTPRLNGFVHFQKPPVYYWSLATSMAVFGENELGVRLTSVLAALGVLLLTFWIGRTWFGSETGRMAAGVLGCSGLFFALGRSACPDMVMTFWCTAAIASFVRATSTPRHARAFFVAYFACMGVAFATKGPVGILVPLMAGVGWQLGQRKSDAPRLRVPWLWGMSLTLALASAWFLVCAAKYPGLGHYFFQFELLDRILSKAHGRSQPVWFFVPVLLVGLQPWTALLPLALSRRNSIASAAHDPAVRGALLAWLLPPFVLLSLSGSKLMTYVLPLLPGLALWLAPRLAWRPRSHTLTVAVAVQMMVFALAGVLPLVLPLLASLLPARVQFDWWFKPAWLTVVAVALAATWELRHGITESSLLRVALASLLVWTTAATQMVNLNPLLQTGASLKPLAERLRAEPGWSTAQIIVAGTRRHGLEFYLGRLVDVTRKHADAILPPSPENALRLHESTSALVLRDGPERACYVVTRDRELESGRFAAPAWTPLAQEGVFVLLKHDPSSWRDAAPVPPASPNTAGREEGIPP